MRVYLKSVDGDIGSYALDRNPQAGETNSNRVEWLNQTQKTLNSIKTSEDLSRFLDFLDGENLNDLDIPSNLQSSATVDASRKTIAGQFNELPEGLRVAFSTHYVAVNERLNQGDYEAAIGIVNAAEVPAGFDTAQFKQIKARFVQAISDLQTLDG